MKTLLLSIIIIVLVMNSGFSQSVNLDPSFGDKGVDTIQFLKSALEEVPRGMALLPDGKILLLGDSYVDEDDHDSALVVRLHPNGKPDLSFGKSGISVLNAEPWYHSFHQIDAQTDGKIIISGSFTREFAMFRTDSEGKADSLFGSGGLSRTNFCGRDAIYDLAVSKTGKIAAAGSMCEFDSRFIIAMFKPDGSLDSTFSDFGAYISEFEKSPRYFRAIELQGNKLVAAGKCRASDAQFKDKLYVVRIDSTGQLDKSFGTSGEFSYLLKSSETITDMVIQKDGKILICCNRILRLNPDGTIDNTFGNNGIVELLIGEEDVTMYYLALQQDGKIVVAGDMDRESGFWYLGHFVIARYDTKGTLDKTFGNNGLIISPIGTNDVYVQSMLVQPDNKILIAGELYNNDPVTSGHSKCKIVIARFLPDKITGIESKQKTQFEITVYPNPAYDFIILDYGYDMPEKLSWQLFDMTGRKVNGGWINQTPSRIYTGNLQPSLYLLQMMDNKNNVVKNLKVLKR